MSKPPYYVCRIPVLSSAHLEESTFSWMQNTAPENGFGTFAVYPEGMFMYLREIAPHDMPPDLVLLHRWVRKCRYGWIRLDADGDVVPGLPLYDW